MDSRIADAMDNGKVEELNLDVLGETADTIEFLLRNVDHSIDREEYGEDHKVAIALDEDEKFVGKLAHAHRFVIADTKGKKILERTTLEADSPEGAVAALKKAGVDMVICSGSDKHLRASLADNAIASVPVLKGEVEDILANFLNGQYSKA